jgi:heme-degrading monooxygenase HmoA
MRSAYIHPEKCEIIRSVHASKQEGGGVMFARVSHFEICSERIQKGYRAIVEHVLPALEMQKGYSGGLLLANSQQGKVLAVSLWESEQEMHATDEASHWFRLFGAEAAEGKVTDVETYEVYIARLDHPQP